MIKNKLAIWTVCFAVVLLGILFSSFLVSRLIQATRLYADTEATLALQRADIRRILLETEASQPLPRSVTEDIGVKSFHDRQLVLNERYRLLGSGWEHMLELERLAEDMGVALDGYVEHGKNHTELIAIARLYMSRLDLVEGTLAESQQETLGLESIVPVVVLIVIVWLTVTVVLYWACFGINYGYDLFMRDLN